ncbi:serine/threonine-protein kinase [Povalibacter uvarum]|uniref:non-specific serine/threonine protein kinase n=1 Tax=Povalibacter uvarum TaxID=732238 RepID=A0A841HGQ2_9GAMM|nr:serine/threonine-protein kinase [Povalibacter uvarum]MBB6091478.1 serine/threonine-protein kinase [Povalibacter uvarum]
MASRLARFSWLPGGIAAAAVIAIGRLVTPSPFAPLELAAYDRAQRSSDPPAAEDIVLVDIDQQSLAELGTWPWPHGVHADLLRELTESGAKVVAFTMPLGTSQSAAETERVRAALTLLEASELGNSEEAVQLRELLRASGNSVDPDAQLSAAIRQHGNVVLPIEIRTTTETTDTANLPDRLFATPERAAHAVATKARITQSLSDTLAQQVTAVGHIYIAADSDGVLRDDIAAVRVGEQLLPSMATSIAARAMDSDALFTSDTTMRIGNRSIALDDQLRSHPHFVPNTAFKRYSYQQVLDGSVPSAELRDKIVIVGIVDSDDAMATPVGKLMTVNAITASTTVNLIQGTTFARPGSAIATEWAVALGVILFAAFILPAAGPAMGALATVLVAAILAIADFGVLGSTNTWVQLLTPAVAAVAGYILYLLGDLVRQANVRATSAKDPTANLRSLGQTFQRQGQLDLAFETYRRCPLDAPTMELLYFLGMDFERRRQNQKAAAVYGHIATRDPNYRDLRARRARVAEDRPAREQPQQPDKTKIRAVPPPPRSDRRIEDFSDDPFGEQQPKSLGRKLGRYELERELGKGAMGVVYLGRDPNINRVVAIKAIPLADEFEENDLEEARARFFREAEMAGRLNHPSIVTVYDAGEDAGLAYIAMEYLRGQHLSHYTDSTRLLPPKTVMTLVARTAEALHYAHRQNVVHRDIKPANIMFNAETDELKITDFGIARLTDTSRTKTGIVLGTPSFMSPEQLEGRSLDGRSDQFALGVSLYQLLTGQLPFRAESMPRLMQKIATEPHTPIRLVRPELPEGLDAIIDRVLAKSADDRYPTCAQFAADLHACAKSLEPEKAKSEHEWLLP